jgi:hypothetical protein
MHKGQVEIRNPKFKIQNSYSLPHALCPMPTPRHLLITLVLIAAMLLLPAAAVGQTKSTFTPRVSVSETYDDNIDLEPHNKNSDWITVVSPGGNFQLESLNTQLALDYEAGFSFYARDSSRDTTRQRARISWDQALAEHLRFNLNDTFSRSEDPITVEDNRITDISRGREVQYRNTGETSMSWQFGAEDQLTAGYRNRLLNSDSDQTEDSRANEGFLNLSTWFIPKFGIDLTSSFSRWEFQQSKDYTGIPTDDFYRYQGGLTMNYRWRPQRIGYVRYTIVYQNYDHEFGALSSVVSEDYVVHQPTVGVSLALGPNTDFGAEFGYFRQEYDHRKGTDGYVGNGSFNTRGQRTRFSIQTSTGYSLDYGTSQNRGFSKYSDNSARVDYQLGENLGIFATARYLWEDFTQTNLTEHTYGGRAGLTYSFRRWLTASLEGGHLRRDANQSDQEFTDNRVALRISTSYPIPFGD